VKAACNALIAKGLLIRSANLGQDGKEAEESTYRLNVYASLPEGVGQKKAHPGQKKAYLGQKKAYVGQKWPGGRPENESGVGQILAPQETGQETGQETAAANAEVLGGEGKSGAADALLVEELVSHGVGRAAAEQLARNKPAVCRRYLEYLPYAKVRTTPGAWLASAIREEYGPPEGYFKRQAAGPERASNKSMLGKHHRSPEVARHDAMDARLRDAFERLEKTHPEAIAAFLAYLAAEQDQARRFAARLSLRRREEYLTTFDSEEQRLRVFGRWLETEGRGFVSPAPPGKASAGGQGRSTGSSPP
jgi:hypothetical protein